MLEFEGVVLDTFKTIFEKYVECAKNNLYNVNAMFNLKSTHKCCFYTISYSTKNNIARITYQFFHGRYKCYLHTHTHTYIYTYKFIL
jgi:hypothetical protein